MRYLSIVSHSTEELQFKVEPSWIFVEQPPQTAGQVLHLGRNIHQSDTRTLLWHALQLSIFTNR